MKQYARALEQEMSLRRHYIKCTRVETMYLGGGTPSLLPESVLSDIFEALNRHFSLSSEAEVTIEANPDDVSPEWLKNLSHTPVNRVSMGAQTFSDQLLHFLGRRHNARQITEAVQSCQEAGISNVSLDLIYGLPGQTMSDWQHDVECALGLGITHLSAYSLSYEEGTRLDLMLRKGLVREADEELSCRMYEYLISATSQAGFVHYEISNFALPGFHSRHNSGYWQGVPYLGLGAGAHSYNGMSRQWNPDDLDAYMAAIEHGSPVYETERLTPKDLYNEKLMLSLRTAQGLNLQTLPAQDSHLQTLPAQDSLSVLQSAENLISKALLLYDNHHLRIPESQMFISDSIISTLFKD